MSASLPVFPWDTLADAKALAGAHPDGIVDLSVGTPVDPVAPLEIAYTFLSGRPCWSTVVARTQLLFSITRNVR